MNELVEIKLPFLIGKKRLRSSVQDEGLDISTEQNLGSPDKNRENISYRGNFMLT